MSVKDGIQIDFRTARHLHGARDPFLLFDLEQLFPIGTTLLLIASVLGSLLAPAIGRVLAMLILGPVVLQMVLVIVDQVFEYLPSSQEKHGRCARAIGSFELLGSQREWRRILRLAIRGQDQQCFRAWLTYGQQVWLRFAAWVALFLYACSDDLRSFVLAGILAVWASVLFSWLMDRPRYQIDGTFVTIQRLSCWRVIDERRVNLTEAHVVANMARGSLEIKKEGQVAEIALRELFCPHRFVSALVGNIFDKGRDKV